MITGKFGTPPSGTDHFEALSVMLTSGWMHTLLFSREDIRVILDIIQKTFLYSCGWDPIVWHPHLPSGPDHFEVWSPLVTLT